jgi:ribosome modulation factor
MAIYNREDSRTALPQLEKQFNAQVDGINSRIDGLLDFFYPVGCYFETSDTSFDPNKSWGGEWELEAEGLVHIGAGENYEAGDTGGSKDSVVVSHTHNSPWGSGWLYLLAHQAPAGGDMGAPSGTGRHYPYQTDRADGSYWGSGSATASAGVAGTNKNMQPYIVVNRWHRTK